MNTNTFSGVARTQVISRFGSRIAKSSKSVITFFANIFSFKLLVANIMSQAKQSKKQALILH